MNIKDKFKILKETFPYDATFKTLILDDYPPGWFSIYDMKQYRELYEMIPNEGKALEVGCFLGRSLSSVSDIIIKKRLKIYAVDLFNMQNWGEVASKLDVDSHYDEFIETMKAFNIHKNVCAFKMSSLDAHIFFENNTFDLIFLDSAHDYNHVLKEIQLYKYKLKPSGMFCGHDLQAADVERAVRESFESYKKMGNSVIWLKTG